MAGDVKGARRAYRSPLRADQAARTQDRILRAAFRLFAERGYARTTVAAIADRASVAPETIYQTFGGKRGLLVAVITDAISGDNDPDRQEDALLADVAQVSGADARLAKMVEYSCTILGRTGPIHAVIRGAADKEPFAGDLGRRLLDDRLTHQTERIRRYVGEDLREGLSVAEAGQAYCALLSPELYHLLTVQLGWTAEHHLEWSQRLLTADLLGVVVDAEPPSGPNTG